MLRLECIVDELFVEFGCGDGDPLGVLLLLLWCCSDEIVSNESREAHESSLECMSPDGESAESRDPINEYFELFELDILWCRRHLALLLLNHT